MKPFKVSLSPHRAIYEEMRTQGATFQQLRDRAKELGEEISMMAFSRYFMHEFMPRVEVEVESQRIIRREADKITSEAVNVLNMCKENIDVLKRFAQSLMTEGKTIEDPRTMNALLPVLREMRLTGKELSELTVKLQQYRGDVETQREIEAMKRALKVLPSDVTEKVLSQYMKELEK